MIVDTHCHLDNERFDNDREAVIERAVEAGVGRILLIGAGATLDNCRAAVRMAEERPELFWACIGIHPHNAGRCEDWMLEVIEELCENEKVVGLGETGLDYYYEYSTPEEQQGLFRKFLALARRTSKPVVLHIRDSHADAQRILGEEGIDEIGGVVHCFSGSRRDAEIYLELGLHLGIPGIVTFRRPGDLPKIVEDTPLDRLLLETDSPFLAPTPYRGKRNEPAYLGYIVEKVAEVRELSVEEVSRIISENAARLFGFPL